MSVNSNIIDCSENSDSSDIGDSSFVIINILDCLLRDINIFQMFFFSSSFWQLSLRQPFAVAES